MNLTKSILVVLVWLGIAGSASASTNRNDEAQKAMINLPSLKEEASELGANWIYRMILTDSHPGDRMPIAVTIAISYAEGRGIVSARLIVRTLYDGVKKRFERKLTAKEVGDFLKTISDCELYSLPAEAEPRDDGVPAASVFDQTYIVFERLFFGKESFVRRLELPSGTIKTARVAFGNLGLTLLEEHERKE